MSEYASGEHSANATSSNGVSLPFLVLSALLIGLGLFGTAYWLVTFNWLYFASLLPLVLGAYMLFTRGTGPDQA
ncbi:MAG TPA: hypothetical protein VEJ85_00535 [Thermoplasmata archaeon]|nr:hypothetical protein [Thermoplasmata archaeon]